MANFVLLYTGGSQPATQAEGAAVMQAWTAWFTVLGGALVAPGNPFAAAAKHIGSDGTVGDGPVGELATGYSIVKADSLEAATKIAKGCPHLKSGGRITVYESLNIM